jgi:glucosamine-6-phosphate deaminase
MSNQTDMKLEEQVKTLSIGTVRANVYPSREALGQAAAEKAAEIINSAISSHGTARVIIATGNSQLHLVAALTQRKDIDWSRVEVFHMDEYVGLPATHPSSFRYWIKTRVEDVVHPAKVNYIVGDAEDIDGVIEGYAKLLNAAPIHLSFVGIGENGHIAFNDPPVADFNDPATLKRVVLDDACRNQQAGEGHFSSAAAVPREAITVTCPGLFRSEAWVCSVPERRKAKAVKDSFEGPVTTACPGSLIQRHPNASVFLDTESASLLSAFD